MQMISVEGSIKRASPAFFGLKINVKRRESLEGKNQGRVYKVRVNEEEMEEVKLKHI